MDVDVERVLANDARHTEIFDDWEEAEADLNEIGDFDTEAARRFARRVRQLATEELRKVTGLILRLQRAEGDVA
jgi:hypothetical protein